jgi:hypothetical protein
MELSVTGVQVFIVVNWNPITEYRWRDPETGFTHNFVEGREGSNFEIEVFNDRSTSTEVVISIDGLDICSG